jgi:hypothetical protein
MTQNIERLIYAVLEYKFNANGGFAIRSKSKKLHKEEKNV